MKIKTHQFSGAALLLAVALFTPVHTRADSGIVSESISTFRQMKPESDAKSLKAGDTMAKVCNGCKRVTLVRIVSVGQGQLNLAKEPCTYCGSKDTYLAIAEKPAAK